MGCGPAADSPPERPVFERPITLNATIRDAMGTREEEQTLIVEEEGNVGATVALALGTNARRIQAVRLGGLEVDLSKSWLSQEIETEAVISVTLERWAGTWERYDNIDMCSQGDVEIIPEWKKTHTIEQLKAIVEEQSYSAVVTGSFGHAALKCFDYQLTAQHCKPTTDYKCTIWIYKRPEGEKPKLPLPGMCLTERGQYNQCIFTHSKALESGSAATLSLMSHDGYGIGKKYVDERRYGPWRYIESQVVEEASNDAITVQYEDGIYLKLVDDDLVLDVAFGKMEVGNAVNFVGGTNDGNERTKLKCAARDFMLNDDGTISPKAAPHLVLGIQSTMPKMVLVDKSSPNVCAFDSIPGPLRLKSHPGFGIGKKYHDERRAGPWRYIESTAIDEKEAVQANIEGDFVMIDSAGADANTDGAGLCLDVAHWKMTEGNAVNFVGGTSSQHKTKQGGGGRDWVFHPGDGTISAKHHPHLVLGLSGPLPSGIFAPRGS